MVNHYYLYDHFFPSVLWSKSSVVFFPPPLRNFSHKWRFSWRFPTKKGVWQASWGSTKANLRIGDSLLVLKPLDSPVGSKKFNVREFCSNETCGLAWTDGNPRWVFQGLLWMHHLYVPLTDRWEMKIPWWNTMGGMEPHVARDHVYMCRYVCLYLYSGSLKSTIVLMDGNGDFPFFHGKSWFGVDSNS